MSRILILIASILFPTLASSAQGVPVRFAQGTTHGFISLLDESGKVIGFGDAVQTIRGSRVTARLTLHFRDGSVDDETTVFTQDRDFHFVSDHHIQRGPFFSKPLDLSLDAAGNLVLRSHDPDGHEKVETNHLDLPPNIANGMLPILLLNVPPGTPESRFSLVVGSGKGRIISARVTPDGTQSFFAGGARRTAHVFLIHPELGGLAGIVAPVIGKQPLDARLWLAEGQAPQLLRMDSQLAEGGPIVSIRLAGVRFHDQTHPGTHPATAALSDVVTRRTHSR